MEIDIDKIAKLVKLVSNSNVGEIVLKEGDEEVKITRAATPAPVVQAPAVAAPIAPVTHIAPVTQAPVVSAPASQATANTEATVTKESANPNSIMKSEMVGTFYRSANPGAEPFVQEGQTVKEGDVVCIIEAMKMMNQIQADRSGKIKKILVENGQTVEYGQDLFEFE